MHDYSESGRDLLAAVEPVVVALSDVIATDRAMLVGAQCRDLLHWRYGCTSQLRRTSDVDVAVALRDWSQFDAIRQRFDAVGLTGHRFLVANVPTDLIPFGEVEMPPGTTPGPSGSGELNVHGFSDAYRHADALALADGVSVRVPTAAGFAVLKLHAWLDRSPDHNYKDGPDLALAVHWYAQDADRLWYERHFWALETYEFDVLTASAALLGSDIRESLSNGELQVLAARLAVADIDLLAHHFQPETGAWPSTVASQREIVDVLIKQLAL